MRHRKTHMRIWIILLVVLFCGSSELAYGQKKTKFSKTQVSIPTIEDVKQVMNSDPEKAIRQLRQIITISVPAEDKKTTAAAYTLLGDVNYSNKLYAQAAERYHRALEYSSPNDYYRLYNKIGKAYLFVDANQSKNYFTLCNQGEYTRQNVECTEGLADALYQLAEYRPALKIYQQLEKQFSNGSGISLARIQAKIADVYAALNNVEQAQINYGNARDNFKPQKSAGAPENSTQSDVEVLQNTARNLSKIQSDEDNISMRKENINYYKDNNMDEELIMEELELTDAYVESGNIDEAEDNLKRFKPIINSIPSNELKADYYKKSSDLYAAEGDFRKAVESYEQYTLLQDSIFTQREQELNARMTINDLQKSVDISEKESINTRNKTIYDQSLLEKQRWLIYLLSALLLGALLAYYLIFRNVKSKQRANQLLELRSLRSEMNPHFIFNALGNVNEYIAAHDERKANRLLSDFSKLMRQVLELNKNDVIPLKQEIELSKLYLKLEHARWDDKFNYTIDISEEELDQNIEVPPLLLQPYIENAVWHGLRYLNGKGLLSLTIKNTAQGLQVVITDNGIGRSQSAALKTKNQKLNQSTGIRNTKRRAELINTLYDKTYQVKIEDAFPDQEHVGTRVSINLSA